MKTTPMPDSEPFAELRLKLDQLNRLEDEGAMTRRSGRSALDSEALIESLRANIPLNVLLQTDRLRGPTKRRRSQTWCLLRLPHELAQRHAIGGQARRLPSSNATIADGSFSS